MTSKITNRIAGLIGMALLAGCSGGYSGASNGTSGASTGTGATNGGGSQTRSMEQFFASDVQPNLDFCRSCHVPGGIADVEKGRKFQLSGDKSQDLANLQASWERLGKNNPTSRLLLMPSGQETPHTGGAPWAQGSVAYKNMEVLLQCFGDPAGCLARIAGGGGGATTPQLPLLGSAHGSHIWGRFCDGKPDDALLPPDPRTLIKPGVNQGKVVMFNEYWKSCSQYDGTTPPTTCGEFRQNVAAGAELMKGNGSPNAGRFGAATHTDGFIQMSSRRYNNLWQVWGLSARPDNFDQLVAERYGTPLSPARNPYPLPGEDPNKSNGGSGQLPATLTQGRTADGGWTSNVAVNCNGCHSDKVGDASDGPGLGFQYGSGNGTVDYGLFGDEIIGSSDYSVVGLINNPAVPLVRVIVPYSEATCRGCTGNGFGPIDLIFNINPGPNGDVNALDPNFLAATANSPSSGETNSPAWWNTGFKTSKFYSGTFAANNLRSPLIMFDPNLRLNLGEAQLPYVGVTEGNKWISSMGEKMDSWLLSLKAPTYPMPVDQSLAEQGAILFHSKNLWAEGLNNPVRKPEAGNGSCAGCHGVYSPRYANDPAYLDSPALEGMAGYIVPQDIIGTDGRYTIATSHDSTNEYVSKNMFVVYPESYGDPENDCTLQTRNALRGARENGIAAPPLYGVWATAPYFHNSSVPSLWEVLKPSDRPDIWRRVSAPARADQDGKVVMGFDTNLQRAYDTGKGGWKYERLSCGTTGTTPYLDCNPSDRDPVTGRDPLVQQILNGFYANNAFLWNIVPPQTLAPLANNFVVMSQRQNVENRKIYNTHQFSHSNSGHEFTSVLTDQERRALIEYLKTL